MKVLFIGGTGLISTACTQLAAERGIEMFLLNRGRSRTDEVPEGVTVLTANVREPGALAGAIEGHRFDAVVNWINFTVPEVERDIAVFDGKVGQYIFISSASAYQKPPSDYLITESAPLVNAHWQVLARQGGLRGAPGRAEPQDRLPLHRRASVADLRAEPGPPLRR